MRCLYINLAQADERRRRIEESFSKLAPPNWTLERIEAAGQGDVTNVLGTTTPAEKGCFVSHRQALKAAITQPGDVMIFEDDATFTARSFEVLEQLLANTEGWEILWTDPSITAIDEFIQCAIDYPALVAAGRFRIKSLQRVQFVGTSSYIVRESAKRKLLELIDKSDIDRAYDLHLANLVHCGVIGGFYAFPFVTTITELAEESQISDAAGVYEAARNLFRHLMFMDRDLKICKVGSDALLGRVNDDHAQTCGAIVAALLCPPSR
jgi:GR25 family glycosyltransferase involved in LPS biosynthesis